MTTACSALWALAPAVLLALCALEPLQKGGTKDKEKKGGTPPKAAAVVPVLQPWKGKLEDAKASAKERNVPILVHVILEAEESNDQYREKILSDADLVKRSAGALVIVANNGSHERKRIEVVVDGEKTTREVCAVYPMFDACAQHQAPWDEIYRDYHEDDGDLKCPQTIVLAPDGTEAGRINTSNVPEPGEIGALVVAAIAKAGPGLTEDQLALVKRRLEEGRRLAADAKWVDAWKSWTAVLAITQKSPFAEEARREEPKALAGMQAELERIAALLVPGTAAKAYADLTRFATELAGTPLEKDVAARLRKAEADKAIQPEIKAWRLSNEADALLREANDLTDGGDAKKAEKVVRRLLGARYAGTPAQETARKLWPEIAAEVGATPPK
ncbi:MAG: hypothetical protein NTY35_07830 [Planctomycetota bacterium]|nr:hypothetical protein [Planctomycetota bacterium]